MFEEENFHVFRDEKVAKEKEKVNRTKLPRRAKNFSKEQLQLALRKKKECNAKAQKVVETLLDPVEDVEKFMLMLRDINQSHYADVVQERAIQLVCGYPLCQQELTNVPSQKYVISLSSKKIYDITDRKNFCRGECYKASCYIKEQLLTSPLWLREQEDIPNFKLLDGSGSSKSDRKTTLGPVTLKPVCVINTDDLQIVERTYPKSGTNCVDGNGSREDIKVSLYAQAHQSESTESRKVDQKELNAGLEKLSLDD